MAIRLKKNKFAKELFSKKYKPRIVKPKKGKGSFKRIKKSLNSRSNFLNNFRGHFSPFL